MQDLECGKKKKKLKQVENETHTLQDLEHVEKQSKCEKWEIHTLGPGLWQGNFKKWKRSHKHCLTRTIPKNTQKRKKLEIHSRTWSMERKLKIMEMRNTHYRT